MSGWPARSLALILCLAVNMPRETNAQAPLGLATAVEADGFRLGEQTIAHVYGNIDTRFDSNPMLRATQPFGDLIFRFRAGGSIARPSDKLELKLSLSFDYSQYCGVVHPGTRLLSAPQGQLDFGLIANRDGKFAFFFNDTLQRIDSAANISVTERMRWTRNFAQIGGDIRPSGSRALEFRASYGLDFTFYDPNQSSVQDSLGMSFMTHVPQLIATWRFFPKTALVGDVQGAFTMYPFPSASANQNLNGLRIQAGLVGQITPKLSVVAKAGYGGTFIPVVASPTATPAAVAAANAGVNYSSAIVNASITFKPSDVLTLTGGYTRDFSPAALFGWMSIDRAFAEFRYLIGARFIADLKAQYMFQNFGRSNLPNVGPRQDHVITGEARFGVQGKAWFGASVYYIPELRLTSFVSPNNTPAAYMRHVVGVDATFGW